MGAAALGPARRRELHLRRGGSRPDRVDGGDGAGGHPGGRRGAGAAARRNRAGRHRARLRGAGARTAVACAQRLSQPPDVVDEPRGDRRDAARRSHADACLGRRHRRRACRRGAGRGARAGVRLVPGAHAACGARHPGVALVRDAGADGRDCAHRGRGAVVADGAVARAGHPRGARRLRRAGRRAAGRVARAPAVDGRAPARRVRARAGGGVAGRRSARSCRWR